jgi:hypothetical protein
MKLIDPNAEPPAERTKDEALPSEPIELPRPEPKRVLYKARREKKQADMGRPQPQEETAATPAPRSEKKPKPETNVHKPRPAPTPMPFRNRPAQTGDTGPRPAATETGPRPATHTPVRETGPRLAAAQPEPAALRRAAPQNGTTPGKKGINPGLRLRAILASSRNAGGARLPFWKRVLRRPEPVQTRRAYFYVTGTISLIVNAILIAALLILARYTIRLRDMVVNDLLYGGLYVNFGEMDQAHIQTEIPINTTVHASIPVTINTTTDVVLTQNTTISGARVTINAGILSITNAPANIVLPAGTVLPVQLNLTVPVEADIPVSMIVPVDIPLNQTELHGPFVGLQDAVAPYVNAFYTGASGPEQVPFCRVFTSLCEWWYLP